MKVYKWMAADTGAGTGTANVGSFGDLAGDVKSFVDGKGWKSPHDVLTSYRELESKTGSMVSIPGKDATDDQRNAFFNKMGRPETVDKYDLSGFKVPDGMPWKQEHQASMLASMHKHGVSQTQMLGLMQDYTALMGGDITALDTAATQFAENSDATLRKDWGGDYEANKANANKLMRAVFGDDLEGAKNIRLQDGTFLFDNPMIAKAFAKVGKSWSEDGGLDGKGAQGGGGATDATGAKAEIAKIRREAAADPKHPYINRSHPDYKATQKRMLELYALANPNGGED